MNVLQKLRQLAADARRPGPGAGEAWALAERLLARLPADRAEAARVVRDRDADALAALIDALERGVAPASQNAPPAPQTPEFSAQELERAFRAFRKRLEITRLDEESRLGNRQLTGGRKSEIDAIVPPREFPDAVWKALARAGRLKDTGQGFYALGTNAPA